MNVISEARTLTYTSIQTHDKHFDRFNSFVNGERMLLVLLLLYIIVKQIFTIIFHRCFYSF